MLEHGEIDKYKNSSKEQKSFYKKVKGFFKRTFSAAADLEDSPFARAIKKVGYAIFKGRNSADDFAEPDFSFDEIDRAYNTDSYVRQGIDKHVELIFKEGWDIVCKDEKIKDYITKRFVMMSDAMDQPIEQFFQEMADDIVKYYNVFLVKARVADEKMPKMPSISIKGLADKKPIGAYFRLAPSSMSIKADKHGTIKKYKQETTEDDKEFKPEEIIHIPYKRPPGQFFGVPFMIPVIDDVKLLRQVEENLSRLVHRHLYPLFVYKVGLDKPGYESTDPEIEDVQSKLNNMPTEGGIAIPERHDINLLDTKSILPVEKYIEIFEKRVFTGMGVSETVMGRSDTSNRSTAENQSSEMRDKAKAFQTVLENYINHYILRELLLEGGYDPVLNPDHQAVFKFRDIDTDSKIKQENHEIFKFEHNAQTHEEMREGLGLEPVTDEARLHNFMFMKTDGSEDTNNRNSPQNQHTDGREYKVSDLLILENMLSAEYGDFRVKVIEEYEMTGYKPYEDFMQEYIKDFFDRVYYSVFSLTRQNYREGTALVNSVDEYDYTELRILFEEVITELKEKSADVFNEVKEDNYPIEVALQDYENHFINNCRKLMIKAHNLGYLNQLDGEENPTLHFKDGSSLTEDLNNLKKDIPAKFIITETTEERR